MARRHCVRVDVPRHRGVMRRLRNLKIDPIGRYQSTICKRRTGFAAGLSVGSTGCCRSGRLLLSTAQNLRSGTRRIGRNRRFSDNRPPNPVFDRQRTRLPAHHSDRAGRASGRCRRPGLGELVRPHPNRQPDRGRLFWFACAEHARRGHRRGHVFFPPLAASPRSTPGR